MTKTDDFSKKIPKILATLDSYETDIANAEDIIRIKAKTLEQALKDQVASAYYDQRHAELKGLIRQIEVEIASVRGGLVQQFNENYSRELGERTINQYINNRSEVKQLENVLIEVEIVANKFSSISEAFQKRGFALRDITAARVAEVHDAML